MKKIFENASQVQPYIAGGVALIESTVKGDFWDIFDLEDDTSEVGFWLGGGVYATISQHVNLGVNVQWSAAEIEWYYRTVDLGGTHIGAFIGYHW